ncbi:MAG TPA: alpha/beta hydrolase [Gemmataceae bacterium]|nr:alpha/beta hydrolase [Gemmataceae bacterium]
MPSFQRDRLSFHYRDLGEGVPFVFQHGLGGDVQQPFGLFQPPHGFRLLAFDCRGHGETRPLGDPAKLGIASFADDLLALLDNLAIERVVVGGISLGAAVALNFALRFPERVLGIVLSRPAWLDGPMLDNARLYAQIARLIRERGARAGRKAFEESGEYRRVLEESPDAANSLLGQFDNPRAEETVAKLERVPQDAPCRSREEWKAIIVPTLVLANRRDPIHPFAFGEILANGIAGAEFRELTAKSVSKERHAADVQNFISAFLIRHFT